MAYFNGKQLNCPNCGAVITGATCEYCGSQFYDFANLELDKAGYIRARVGEQLITFKAIPTSFSVDYDTAHYYADGRVVLTQPSYTVKLEMAVVADSENILFTKRKL